MLKGFQDLSALLQGLNSKKTKHKGYDLPHDYVISKFYELGFYPQHNTGQNTYQCSCPICREGKSFGRKKRCFFLPDRDQIYCHNCGWKGQPFFWIKELTDLTDEDIWGEVEDESYDLVDITANEDTLIIRSESLPEDCINLFDPLQCEYYRGNNIVKIARDYLYDRRIDRAINRPDAVFMSLKDRAHRNRIVFPFKDEEGEILFYQSRAILDKDKDGPTYLSRLNADKSLFNAHNIDYDLDEIFIFEGPIDSMFVKNAVGLGGINEDHVTLTAIQKSQMDSLFAFRKIWCLDSQHIDQASRTASEELLERGEEVFIWPEELGTKYKDLNALCVDKKLNGIGPTFIKNNTYSGKEGIIKLKMIK